MNQRIKMLRDYLGLTRAAFGNKLGLTGDAINNWERGRSDIKDYFVKLICAEYNINEDWLRNGNGEMFNQNSKSALQQLKEEYNLSDIEFAILDGYLKLSDKQREAVENFLHNILTPQPPEDITTEIQEDANKDEYIDGVAARGNSEQKVRLSKKAVANDLNKPMSTGFDD